MLSMLCCAHAQVGEEMLTTKMSAAHEALANDMNKEWTRYVAELQAVSGGDRC